MFVSGTSRGCEILEATHAGLDADGPENVLLKCRAFLMTAGAFVA
jgi:hypothetical protein